jgi:alkanesulfonate monooxygenase SsuD/methylene tetrahydromethanopterin reductase-like flavin-dependent oxidoreductase (luciferase family)
VKLRLGLRYDLRAPSDPARLYADILEHADRADALGVDALWISERPFAQDAALPAALPLCAALAVRTRRARVGTAVLPLPLYHPLRLAEDAATIDGLSGGRFDLGLGLGGHAEAFDGFGVPMQSRLARFDESLRVLRLAFAAGPLSHAGEHYRFDGLEVWPKPFRTDGPPLWIGVGSDTIARMAAQLADGAIAGSVAAASGFLEAWAEHGRDPLAARVALEVARAADPDPVRARAALEAAAGALGGAGELCVVVPVFDGMSGPGPGPGLGLDLAALERFLAEAWAPVRDARRD